MEHDTQVRWYDQPTRPQRPRLLRWNRSGALAGAFGLVLLGGAVAGGLSLAGRVSAQSDERGRLTHAARLAQPAGARHVVTGVYSSTAAYSLGDVAAPPEQVVPQLRAPSDAYDWQEIPGSATGTTRSYLSAAKDRLLDISVRPCGVTRTQCPAGGSTVTVTVSVGGPGS
jgi:hypothetical protein